VTAHQHPAAGQTVTKTLRFDLQSQVLKPHGVIVATTRSCWMEKILSVPCPGRTKAVPDCCAATVNLWLWMLSHREARKRLAASGW
jgi:hypothetical protein